VRDAQPEREIDRAVARILRPALAGLVPLLGSSRARLAIVRAGCAAARDAQPACAGLPCVARAILRRFHGSMRELLEDVPAVDPDARGRLMASLAEGSLDAGGRARHGAVYTETPLARRVLEEGLRALDSRAMRILDPACGGGEFLAAAAARPDLAGVVLRGLDRDVPAVEAARARLDLLRGRFDFRVALSARDALARPPEGGFDLVIGNPPYVRQEALGGLAAKRRLAERLERWLPGAGEALGGKADLSIAFLLLGLSRLRPGGVLAFVTSNAWLDTLYGAPFRAFVATRCEVRLVAEWEGKHFARAAVNPVVVVLRRPRGPTRAIARFIVTGTGRAPRTRHAAPRTLAGGGAWGSAILRRSDLLAEVTARNPRAFAPLGDVAHLAYGTKPGLVDFFVVDPGETPIEPRFLRPVLASTTEIRALEVRARDLPRRLFVCPLAGDALAAWPGAAAHVARGAAGVTRTKARHTRAGLRWPEVPSVRGNRPWYHLRPRPGGDFAVPLLLRERLLFAWTPDRVLATNMFFQGRFRDEALALPGTAILNSSLVLLALETRGRINIGGRINVYGPELRPLPVPDPARMDRASLDAIAGAFVPLRRRRPERASDEAGRADRRALDVAVLEAAGLPVRLAPLLSEALAERVARRLRRESAREPFAEPVPRSIAPSGCGAPVRRLAPRAPMH